MSMLKRKKGGLKFYPPRKSIFAEFISVDPFFIKPVSFKMMYVRPFGIKPIPVGKITGRIFIGIVVAFFIVVTIREFAFHIIYPFHNK